MKPLNLDQELVENLIVNNNFHISKFLTLRKHGFYFRTKYIKHRSVSLYNKSFNVPTFDTNIIFLGQISNILLLKDRIEDSLQERLKN